MNKQTVSSFFEFKILSSVFSNLGDYCLILLKTLLLLIIFGMLFSPIGALFIGIPSLLFTRNIYFADFYRRQIK